MPLGTEPSGKGEVLVINTGGTIAMVNSEPGNPLSPLTPARNWKEIEANFKTLEAGYLGVESDYCQFEPLLDSSDIRCENWQEMAQVIKQHYDSYKGFVILHGTDTMCYTAAALSFMLENLDKPVIITGSQIPLVQSRSDALQNFITAIKIAATDTPHIPEVCIFFRDRLLRGNRARKLSSSGYSGFESPNYPVLAIAGEHIDFRENAIRQGPGPSQNFYVSPDFDTHVMVLEIFPGFEPQVLKRVLESHTQEKDKIKGLVLKTFGAGNAPGNPEFLKAIEKAAAGAIVVDVTQCPEGMVELGLYEASSGLLDRGVISALDMTPEAAICKLMYLLGKGWPVDEVKRQMQLDQRGEQRLNIYNVKLEGDSAAAPTGILTGTLAGEMSYNRFSSASLRVQDAEATGEGGAIEVRVFVNFPDATPDTPTTEARFVGKMSAPVRKKTDLFCSISDGLRRLVQPGQMMNVTLVACGGELRWDKVALSAYTRV